MENNGQGDGVKRRKNARRCRICGEFPTPDNPLSARSKHYPCGEKAMIDNTKQIRSRIGPRYQVWVESMARSLESITGGEVVVILESETEQTPSEDAQNVRRLA